MLNGLLCYTNYQQHQLISNINGSTIGINTVIANRTSTLKNIRLSTQVEHVGMSASHIGHLKTTHIVEMTILHTIHTRDGKIEDITTTENHLDHHIETMIS